MAGLADAFKKSRRSMSNSTAPLAGNIILQATEFGAETVKGKVIGGQHDGAEIEVKYAGTLGQKDYTKKRGKSEVSIENGGTLRIERLKAGNDGVYSARWIKTFNGQPKPGQHSVIPDAVCKFTKLNGRDKEDRPKMRVSQLMVGNEVLAKSMDELKDAIKTAFEAEGAVTLFGMDGDTVIEAPYFLSGQMVDKKWEPYDPAEKAEDVIASLSDVREQVEKVLEDKGFSVVPMRSYAVGPTTAEMIEIDLKEAEEKGAVARISTLDPQNWAVPTIGMRLEMTLGAKGDNALEDGAADKLKAAFNDFADKSEAEVFGKAGFRGLSNATLTRFFESKGVELKEHPAEGWSTQSLLEDKLEGMDRGFVIKGFPLKSTAPYPAVEACKDARQAFYTEMKGAVEELVANLRIEAGAGQKVDPEAKAEAEAAAAQDDLPDDAGDALDELLGGAVDEMELDNN